MDTQIVVCDVLYDTAPRIGFDIYTQLCYRVKDTEDVSIYPYWA